MKTNKEFLEELLNTNKNNLNFIADLANYLRSPFSLISSPKSTYNHEIKTEIIDSFVENVPNVLDNENTKKYLNKCLRAKNITKFKEDKYIKLLNEISYSNLTQKPIKPYEIFVAGNSYFQFDDNKFFINLGFFKEQFSYPILNEFSLSPEYIENVDLPIKVVKGKVLILGLKLGYFTCMASYKNDVKEIYVAEPNKDLINFFETNVLPKIQNREKIHIINEKPMDFIDKINDGDFNYVFIDAWNNSKEATSKYIAYKSRLDNFVNTQSIYYQEESIVTELEFGVTNALLKLSENELTKKLTNYKFVNVYDYRKLFSFKGLLEIYKK